MCRFRPVAVGGIAFAAGRIDQHIVQEETIERGSRRGAGVLTEVEQVIHIFRGPFVRAQTGRRIDGHVRAQCQKPALWRLRIRDGLPAVVLEYSHHFIAATLL